MFLTPGSKATRKRVPTTTGGSGTPGGVNTDVQFNNAGAFGGDAGFTYTSGAGQAALTTSLTLSSANAVIKFTGTSNGNGGIFFNPSQDCIISYTGSGASGQQVYSVNNNTIYNLTASGFQLTVNKQIQFFSNASNPDVTFGRLGFSVIGLSNAQTLTNPVTFQVYNTTDTNALQAGPTNYERGILDWTTNSNQFTIGPQAGGTGSLRDMALIAATKNIWMLNSANTKIGTISGAVGQQHHADYGGI